MDRFNKEALEWDNNPKHLEASRLALDAIRRHVPEARKQDQDNEIGLDVIEIGCGTGLLSLMVAPHVRSLIGVDTAEGMIKAFKAKIAQGGVSNVQAIHVLLEDPDEPKIQFDPASADRSQAQSPRRFDLVISHLVLHHIPDLESTFKTMFGLLKSGGKVALTDYEDFGSEARRFHPSHKMEGVERHGIQRDAARDLLTKAGFRNVRIETAFVLEKQVTEAAEKGTELMQFPFLLCLGQKP